MKEAFVRLIIVLLVGILVFCIQPIRAENGSTIMVPDDTSTNDWTDVKNFIIKYNDTHVWFRTEYHKDIPNIGSSRYIRIYIDTDLDGKGDFWIDPELWVFSDHNYPIHGKSYGIYEKSFYEMGIKLEDIGSLPAIGLPHIVLCSMVYDDLETLSYIISEERNIKIDGRSSDWRDVEPKLHDPEGDTGLQYVDITDIYVTSNRSYIFLRFDFSKLPYIDKSFEERRSRLRLAVFLNTYRFEALFWISNEGVWRMDFTPQGTEWKSSHIAMDECIEIGVPLSAVNASIGSEVKLRFEFSAEVEDYVKEGQVISFKNGSLKLEVVTITGNGIPAKVTIREDYSREKRALAMYTLNDSGTAYYHLPLNRYTINVEFGSVYDSITILPEDLLSGKSIRVTLPLIGPPFISISLLIILIILISSLGSAVAIYLMKAPRKAAALPPASPTCIEKEIKKYEEYLERLEQLRKEGKISERVYERLKQEYEKKLEELINKWRK
jgi:hypothetical protein